MSIKSLLTLGRPSKHRARAYYHPDPSRAWPLHPQSPCASNVSKAWTAVSRDMPASSRTWARSLSNCISWNQLELRWRPCSMIQCPTGNDCTASPPVLRHMEVTSLATGRFCGGGGKRKTRNRHQRRTWRKHVFPWIWLGDLSEFGVGKIKFLRPMKRSLKTDGFF